VVGSVVDFYRSLARLLDSRTQRDIANYRERPEACFALLWTLIWGTLVTPKRTFWRLRLAYEKLRRLWWR